MVLLLPDSGAMISSQGQQRALLTMLLQSAEWGGWGVLVPKIELMGVGKSSFVRALVNRVMKGELRKNLEVLKPKFLGP